MLARWGPEPPEQEFHLFQLSGMGLNSGLSYPKMGVEMGFDAPCPTHLVVQKSEPHLHTKSSFLHA